jgi:hypothetical protein
MSIFRTLILRSASPSQLLWVIHSSFSLSPSNNSSHTRTSLSTHKPARNAPSKYLGSHRITSQSFCHTMTVEFEVLRVQEADIFRSPERLYMCIIMVSQTFTNYGQSVMFALMTNTRVPVGAVPSPQSEVKTFLSMSPVWLPPTGMSDQNQSQWYRYQTAIRTAKTNLHPATSAKAFLVYCKNRARHHSTPAHHVGVRWALAYRPT